MLLAERYRVIRPLGFGGMATVFLAEDERLARPVAVKRLHAERAEELAPRFEREARLGAALNHPNVVAIYDSLAAEDGLLLVMEYVEGQPLSELLTQGALEPGRAIEVLRGVAAALDYAHGQGVVHRDVKPANVLLRSDGVVKLSDLGIATAAEVTQLTTSGTVLGTAAYMAPERLEGDDVGPPADIYALAAVAFEVLSGEKAQRGETALQIAHRVATEPPPDLTDVWPAAPPGAAEAVKRGMAREPGERPASAGELARDLERGLERRDPPEPATVPLEDHGRAHWPAPSATPAWSEASYGRAAGRQGNLVRWLVPAGLLAALAAGVVAALSAGGGDPRDSTGPALQPAKKRERPRTAPRAPTAAPTRIPAAPERAPSQTAGPSEGARLNRQGYRLTQQGRYEEAVPVLERAVAAYPRGTSSLPSAYALYNYGRALRLAGRPAEAIPILEDRLRIDNQRATVRRELEAARRAAGRSP